MSDTPKKAVFSFVSFAQNPMSWDQNPGFFGGGVITCLTDRDAKKAEELFNGLQRENNALRNIIKGAHGALMDARDIPMPSMDEDLYDPVMTIVTQRNHSRAQLAEKDAALAVCVDAFTAITDGDCRDTHKAAKCIHDKYGYEDCEQCYQDFARNFIANIPESAKQYAKVIEAARKVERMVATSTLADSTAYPELTELGRAVRGMKG